jgi:predicted phage terminase large subunit-like protein
MGQSPATHHRLLIAELERLWNTPGGRLAVFMPPGSAKSTYCSSLFPAWVMAQAAHTNVIAASHTASLAENFSRKTQALIAENQKALGIGLARENAELWSTTNGCSYRAAGVGGTITGFRSDLWVIDDPVANRQQAESEVEREKTWNWFNADLLTRSKPGARGLLVQTRWHADDLGGRIMELQKDKWRVINLPATALEDDPLGRAPGALLWDNDPTYPYGAELRVRKAEYEANGAMRDWQALFEQDPRPGDGGVIQAQFLKTIEAPRPYAKIVRAWDFAATAQTGTRNPDWTVGVKMAVDADKKYTVLDVVRVRGGPDEVESLLMATAAADGKSVQISMPQDPGQAGKSQVLYFTRKLAGYAVTSSPETGDKATRAMPFASQVNVGNVSIMRGPWNAAFVEELGGFPSLRHDDQVDASSRAFNTLVSAPGPIRRASLHFMGR